MKKEEIKKYVDVVASGYEFVCPVCKKFNKIIELDEIIICKECNENFYLGDVITDID